MRATCRRARTLDQWQNVVELLTFGEGRHTPSTESALNSLHLNDSLTANAYGHTKRLECDRGERSEGQSVGGREWLLSMSLKAVIRHAPGMGT